MVPTSRPLRTACRGHGGLFSNWCLSLDEYREGLLGRSGALFNFGDPPCCFPQRRHQFTAPAVCVRTPLPGAPPSPRSLTESVGVQRLLTAVSICVSLTTGDAEHLFVGLLATCVSSSGRGLSRSSAHFFNWIFFLLTRGYMSSLCILGCVRLLSGPVDGCLCRANCISLSVCASCSGRW